MKGLKTQNLNKMKKQFGQCFDVSEKNTQYLKTSIKRSKGKLPEMEVAKAHMKILKKYVKDRSKILDAGCLTRHFYKSFSKHFKTKKIEYYGNRSMGSPYRNSQKNMERKFECVF